MKKFALAVLFSLAGLAGFGELAGLPGVVKHKYIEPGTYVSTDTWMTVSGRVDGVATKRANDAAKKYASTSCARILPPYLHEVSFDDVYPDDAAWFYQQVGHAYTGHCSARRNGNVLERNFDWKFNEAPTFVIRISAAAGRFASLGVATIGDLVTEGQVNSHQWFPYFRCLPGHTVDGVNERGVVCEVNVTDGTWPRTEGEIHGLGAVRWSLDYGTNAQQVAEYLAEHVYLPEGFGGNLHWIVADATSTYIVEDGEAIPMTEQPVVMTNFSQDRTGGEGYERWASLTNLATTIESQWWTKAYDRDTRPIRLTDLGPDYEQIWTYWAQYPKELHRNQKIGGVGWWQTVHCSKYDISGMALVIAVQEQEQWYRFALQVSGGGAVKSVNGETGDVELDAAKVGAIAAGENPNGSFSLDPPGSFIGGTSITFSNSEISHSSHGTPDVEDVTPEYWNWITFGGLGIGDWVDFWSYNNAPVKSVNSKTGSVTLNYSDVGAWDGRYEVAAALALGYHGRVFPGGTPSYSLTWSSTEKRYVAKWPIGEIPTSRYLAYTSDLNDYVPTSRKVNNKNLSGDITLSASDVGAVAQGTLHAVATSGSYNDLNNKPTIPPAVTDEHISDIAEQNRTSHPYLESRDGGIYVVIP